MRFILALTLCVSISLVAQAQKIKENYFKYNYLHLPAKQLNDSLNTYSINFRGVSSTMLDVGITDAEVRKALNLTNFKYVEQGGHLSFKITAGKYSTEKAETVAHTKTTKDKEGVEKKTTTYTFDVAYRYPTKVRFSSVGGPLEEYGSTGAGNAQAVSGTMGSKKAHGFPSKTKALEAGKKQLAGIGRSARKKALLDIIAKAGKDVRDKYDTYGTNERRYLEYPAGKKVANQEAWESHATAAAKILEAIPAGNPLANDVAPQLDPHIAFWKEKAAQFDPAEKKQRKFNHIAVYNLATVYYALEDFTSAEPYATILKDHKTKSGYNKLFLTDYKKGKAALGKPNYDSRHFALRDLSAATGLPVKEEVVEAIKAVPITYDSTAAYVISNGVKTGGVLVRPSRGASYKAGKQTIKFYGTDGSEISLNPTKVQEFGHDDLKVIVKDRPYGNTGLKKRPSYFRVVEDGENIRLLSLIPFYTDQEPINTDFLELPLEDGKMVSLDFTNIKWLNWKKSFADFFFDCEVLYAEVRVGMYKNTISDVARAIRSYNDKPCE